MKKAILKALSVMLAVVLTLTAAPLSGFVGLNLPEWLDFSIKSSAATSGTCGENVYWDFDESTGTLTVSGTGAMYNYDSYNSSPWSDYKYEITKVIINANITSIGSYAFYNCNNLLDVVVSNTVIVIGSSAFRFCTKLKNVDIPNEVTTIGEYAFAYCEEIENIIIPDSVTSVGSACFYRCKNLKNISLSNNIVALPYDTEKSGYQVEYRGFFAGCSSLEYIVIPNGVKIIEHSTFDGCSMLNRISIGRNVESISEGVLSTLPLNYISVDLDNKYYSNDECGVLFNKDKTTLIQYPVGNTRTNYTIPDSVKAIGNYAFSYCDSLISVEILDGVTIIGHYAFSYCNSLTSITIPDSVTTIGSYAFNSCSSVTSVIIGKGVTEICNRSFSGCSKLKNIDIPNSVNSIGSFAFAWCTSLEDVEIPNSVTTLGDAIFYRCSNLQSATISNNIQEISSKSEVSNYQVEYSGFFEGCSNLKKVIIPESVVQIDKEAFYGCSNLTDVYYGGSEEQWKKISIGSSNSYLTNATIHYNSTGGNTEPKPDYAIITGDLRFANDTTWNEVKNYKYSYSDEFFTRNSSEYHHDLALMSMVLEASACVPSGAWDGDKKIAVKGDDSAYYSNKRPLNAELLLNNIGYSNQRAYGYNVKPTFNSIACVIGSKNINDDTTVIAIAVRGSGYEAEWGGNFQMGASTMNHEGFDVAKAKVLNYVEEFVKENGHAFNSNVKVWVTGYSRGAATANLVAAEFNKGIGSKYSNTQGLGITKDDVYGYFFETPKNTADVYANSSKYNNLFSIVNPIDPVPYLAPGNEGFGFKRYGVTYFTPAAETTSGYNGKNGIKAQMSAIHEQIYGTKYEEKFTYYSLKPQLVGTAVGFKIVENTNMGQTTFVNNLIFSLAKTGFKNRQNYYDNMQGAMMKLLAMAMGGYGTVDSEWLVKQVALFIYSRIQLGAFSPFSLLTLKHDLASIISDNTEITFEEAYDIVGELDSILLAAVGNLDLTLTTAANVSSLFKPHYFDVLVGWMAYLDSVPESQRKKMMSTELKLRYMKTNCPVDVNVYDEDGTLVASIVNDEVVSLENSLSTYIDENGQKCVVLPYDAEYRVEITAREDCEVTCSVLETDGETGANERVINYYNMEVDGGETISCTAEEEVDNSNCEYTMTDEDGKVIDADETLEDDEISYYTVNAESNADEITVLGSGEFIKGEFAQVSAVDVDGYEFVGWYIDDELVTSDYQYRFCVVNDVTIMAKYEKTPDKPVYNYTFYIQQPSRTEIRNKDGIILHAKIDGNVPEGTYIKWGKNNNNFSLGIYTQYDEKVLVTAENKGYTTFTAILCDADGNELARDSVEMYSKSGFFDKIGGFFRSLFGSTKIYSK